MEDPDHISRMKHYLQIIEFTLGSDHNVENKVVLESLEDARIF